MQEEERESGPGLVPSLSFRETPIPAVESPRKIYAVESSEAAVEDEEEEEFEFAFVLRDPKSVPLITADDIFSEGRVRPVYPVFGRDLLLLSDDGGAPPPAEAKEKAVRLPLGRLLMEEREEAVSSGSLSSSLSESDELEGIPPDSYCVWKPRGAAGERCRKSRSTGSSLRWRLRDLVVGRSHSDGKEKFVFIDAEKKNPAKSKGLEEDKMNREIKKISSTSNGRRIKDMDVITAHQVYYGKSGGGGAGAKTSRRLFLPYKPELLGFFANVNGLSGTHHPF